jgi:hypothetical protein
LGRRKCCYGLAAMARRNAAQSFGIVVIGHGAAPLQPHTGGCTEARVQDNAAAGCRRHPTAICRAVRALLRKRFRGAARYLAYWQSAGFAGETNARAIFQLASGSQFIADLPHSVFTDANIGGLLWGP